MYLTYHSYTPHIALCSMHFVPFFLYFISNCFVCAYVLECCSSPIGMRLCNPNLLASTSLSLFLIFLVITLSFFLRFHFAPVHTSHLIITLLLIVICVSLPPSLVLLRLLLIVLCVFMRCCSTVSVVP